MVRKHPHTCFKDNYLLPLLRRAALLGALVLVILASAGCWDRKEINDLAFVMGAAIDQKSDGVIELSVQVFLPKAAGAGQATGGQAATKGSGSEQTMVRYAEGISIADAMSHLQERLPREIFWGHNEVYIFGEARAQHGIREDVDFILRSSKPRERSQVFISKGQAKDTLELIPPLERNSSEVLRELSAFHTGLEVTMKNLAEQLTGDTNAGAIPYIVKLPPEPGKPATQTISYIQGSAIFKNGKMVGTMDNRETRGILWLRNEVKKSFFTVTPDNSKGYVSVTMIRSYTQLIPTLVDGTWKMTVHIETENGIQQNTTGNNLGDLEWLKTVETSLDEAIKARIQTVLKIAQKDYHSDIFGFADAFHKKHPKQWNLAKGHWSDVFTTMEVEVLSHSRILRPGVSNSDAISPQKGVDSQ
ncbi:Ger(x)C family spore germination protein [Paenibacillus agricola]|uniref:Ger(X)C family spore germination protein n=1 Tax=Paenibacillus agricola TaxID=2716264 RepID=A0ABX0J2V3_9BACL|nr:Ger(x)C family spore germination protein [Paenibacillus agricola]NHN29202.1 Ger(x)C family spore germination protein [Paenibacillus agricola]